MIQRVNVSIPEAWHAALTVEAEKRGLTLSAFLLECAAEKVPARARKSLPKPKGRGRPKGK